jgi:predicted aminopeptidase
MTGLAGAVRQALTLAIALVGHGLSHLRGMAACLLVLLWGLAGCAGSAAGPAADAASATGLWSVPGYYWQSVRGHMALMYAARPIDSWLADPTTPQALKDRLALAQRMRRFAVDELAEPDNASYTRYADLKRRAAVWNVVAASEFSLTLQTWCYPVLGCVGYRGYFDPAQAEAFATGLRAQGLEAAVYPVPAYSTLGWMNWLGGDPLLNTFVGHVEGELARLMFHELAHQLLYVPGDTVFNESFATAVERLGGQRWLQERGSAQARADYARFDERRRAFRALTAQTREDLKKIYALALDDKEKLAPNMEVFMRAQKQAVMAEFHARYAALKAQWGGYSGFDPWVAQINNATLALGAAYDERVPAFEALFAQQGHSFPRFYDAVRELARLPQDERDARLDALQLPSAGDAVAGTDRP